MDTMSIPAHFDGEQIRLDEPIQLEPNTRLLVTVLTDETERRAWFLSSARNLEEVYGENEPEYSLDSIQEANPAYEGR